MLTAVNGSHHQVQVEFLVGADELPVGGKMEEGGGGGGDIKDLNLITFLNELDSATTQKKRLILTKPRLQLT